MTIHIKLKNHSENHPILYFWLLFLTADLNAGLLEIFLILIGKLFQSRIALYKQNYFYYKYFHLELKKFKFVAPLVKLLFKLKFSYRYAGACP